jgi:hypothetical protein
MRKCLPERHVSSCVQAKKPQFRGRDARLCMYVQRVADTDDIHAVADQGENGVETRWAILFVFTR